MTTTASASKTTAQKQRLRSLMAKHAAAIPQYQRVRAEAQMLRRALALPELRAARGVLACLSFGDEPETRPLIQALADAGKQIYLPRADPKDRQLHAHAWPCELHQLRFGLQQPARTSPQLDDDEIMARIDTAIILGPAFDRSGVRLGHGSGYVDRFLAKYPVYAIGLSFEIQVVSELPRALHDVPMSMVLTERQVLRIRAPNPASPSAA
ncbi:5-formyltetrahydrofolate cyclo-ligase [Enhygromyxa salina]|uniref:5-formyltetrahydrofolate cyclo-ligase n=1 Tax=Enhygromyxa salina TaxID=215803 RepID=A0A0C2D4V1_9BACT|nr:5-formyltetrahydrofolate cyclo-ligase [Enhygromyxa salina]KIG16700.1 5-formyltetrahydrofolate cyclo-ligase [Enhygromyxa salina]